ncbi:MAG TPA: O-antigen ligase domain-containing protein [Gammaproteobacteria bacterium]|nr:O-antigen ligase domain-containing protein [Gammaproteobacteria bacterium]
MEVEQQSSVIPFVLYLVMAVLFAGYSASKADRKGFAFIIVFWILSGPVLATKFYLKAAWMPFGLPPERILFLIFLSMIVVDALRGISEKNYPGWKSHRPGFDKYLYIYVLLVIVAVAVNYQSLEPKSLIAIPLEPITFVLMYLVIRKNITQKTLKVFLNAIVIMGVVNALISLVQVAVDPMFLRTEAPRRAFGDVYRAFGIFRSEYVLGHFQMIALFAALTLYKTSSLRWPVVSLIALSILTTFHRLDILVLMISVLIYMRFYTRRRLGPVSTAMLVLAIVSVLPIYSLVQSSLRGSAIVQERLMADTVSGRLKQFGIVIEAMPGYPLGMGSLYTPAYQELMISNGLYVSGRDELGRQTKHALEVHNGFLSIGIQYGILAMIVFTWMFWKMIDYFRKRMDGPISVNVVSLFSVLTWMLANSTNGIVLFRDHNVLVVALMIGAFSGWYIKTDRVKTGI